MASFEFLKAPEDEFHDKINYDYDYLRANSARLGIPDPSLTLRAPKEDYNTKYDAAKDPNRTKTAVALRQEARDTLRKAFNKYGKEHVFNNPNLTLNDKLVLCIHIDKTEHTKIPKPEGHVEVRLSFPGESFKVAVHLGPEAGSEEIDPRSEYGYAIHLGLMPPGGATLEQAASAKHYLMRPPVSGGELQPYKFTHRNKEVIDFDPHEAGMTAYFCARYENQKGEPGKWGRIVSVVVPS